jgi:hypothetical protein
MHELVRTGIATSIKRTVVPILVGLLVSVALRLGFDVNEAQEGALAVWLEQGLGALVAILWYVIPRALEGRWPAIGILLGSKHQPVAYATPDTIEGIVIESAPLASAEDYANAPDDSEELDDDAEDYLIDATPVGSDYEPKHA